MNAKGFRAEGSLFLPDPWCNTEEPYPQELSVFSRFIASNVRDNSRRENAGMSKFDALRFLLFMARHGLRGSTVAAVVRQIWSDTVLRQKTWWRRAVLLDKFQFDVFKWYWDRNQPDFSSFFLNSTAHYQHAYWHCLFPEEFPASGNNASLESYKDAILFGYQEMDKLLASCFELESQGATLVLSTALSQHANVRADRIYYRPLDAAAMLARLGITPAQLLPVMADSFAAQYATQAETDAARGKLASLRCNGRPVITFGPAPDLTLYFSASAIRDRVEQDVLLEGYPGAARFGEIFYPLPHTKSGAHHPDSVLWFKDGVHQVHADKVSILDILPTILEYLGIPRKAADPQNVLEGSSLLPGMESTTKAVAVGSAC
jgi:hypothetical protein